MKNHENKDLSLSNLKEARASLAKFMKNNRTEQEQVSIIRAFKFCYELSCKTLQKFLYNEGIEVESLESIIRESVKFGIIKDKKLWCDFSKKRNKMMQIYSGQVVKRNNGSNSYI